MTTATPTGRAGGQRAAPLRAARAEPAPPRRRRAGAVVDAALGGPLPGRLARWDTPALTYTVLQGATLLLLGIGLVMVLSSSSVDSLTAQRSPFQVGVNQAVFAALGLVAMLVVSRLPIALLRRTAGLAVVLALGAEVLVFSPLGVAVLGNRNWIAVAGFTLQPSELGKLALVLWCAAVAARRSRELHRPRRWVVLLGLGVVPLVGAVLVGRDLGTALVMLLLVGGALFTAGVPLRLLVVPSGLAGLLVAGFVLASGNRRGRIEALLTGSTTGAQGVQGTNYQPIHGLWGLASGGLTGVGLGGSRQKWDWLPEANSDFIYAIIGEELGLVGALVVIALFGVLAWACARVVRRSRDLFTSVLVGGVMAWVLGQAAINVAVVLKLLPVIGLPLPLISAGGSALVCTLAALGLVMACARSVPGARAALGGRRGALRRSLAVVARPGGRR